MRRVGRLLLIPLDALIVLLILIDEVARPLYRPLLRWAASLQFFRRLEAWVAARHRFTILILLAVPFAIAEPLKVVALVWIGRGAVASGVVTLALAYLASFVLVERVFSAGRDKLLTIRWFACLLDIVLALRAALFAWARQTAAWRAVERVREVVRRFIRTSRL